MVRSLPHLLVLQILFMKRNKSYDKLSIEDVDKAIMLDYANDKVVKLGELTPEWWID